MYEIHWIPETDVEIQVCGPRKNCIVDALHAGEVDRFRSDKAAELDVYLRENGYIVSREPLDDEEIRLRMTERLVDRSAPREQAAARASDLVARVSRG